MFFYLFWVLLGRPGILCGFNCKIGRESSFNNDAKYEGVTRDTLVGEFQRKFEETGYIMNHARVKIESGHDAFMKGKQPLQNWGYVSSFCH